MNAEKTELLRRFRAAAAARAADHGISPALNDWNLVSIAEEAGINLFQFSRDAELLYSIWVSFLTVMREIYPQDMHKYPTLAEFLSAYPDFERLPAAEQSNLWHTANWMAILFTMIPAAKNKGLVLQVIPQLVEGPTVKYITGSGQTEATACRVQVYEREGNIVVAHRSGVRSARKKVVRGKQSAKKTPLRRRADSLGSNSSNSGGSRPRGPRIPSSSSPGAGAGAGAGAGSGSGVGMASSAPSSYGGLGDGSGFAASLHGHSHGHGHAVGGGSSSSHSHLPYARRPRSGTGSSSTDGEFRSGDEGHDEDGGYYHEDEDEDVAGQHGHGHGMGLGLGLGSG